MCFLKHKILFLIMCIVEDFLENFFFEGLFAETVQNQTIWFHVYLCKVKLTLLLPHNN